METREILVRRKEPLNRRNFGTPNSMDSEVWTWWHFAMQESEPMRLECGNPSRTIVFIEIPAGFAELGPPEPHGFRSLNLMTLECSSPSTTIVFIKNPWVLRRFWKHRGQAQRAQRATERNREHRKQAQRTQGATEPESIQKNTWKPVFYWNPWKNAFLWTGLPFKVVL